MTDLFQHKQNCKTNDPCTWEPAWCSDSVTDYHATIQGAIPGGKGVKPSFTSFARDS